MFRPASEEELASVLRECAARKRPLHTVGGGTKLRVVKNQVAGQWKAVEASATEGKK
jgi:UDP-N-acetylenolpyruvoylglucosamine reductase